MERECLDKKFEIDMEKDVEREYKQILEKRLKLVHVSEKIKQETLIEMKRDLVENGRFSAEELSHVTNIGLISLMEDKGIIKMKDCTYLESIFSRMNQHDLIKKLPGKCKYFISCYSMKTYFSKKWCKYSL